MKTLTSLSDVFDFEKVGDEEKDSKNLKMTTRETWNNRSRFL